jgi:hypothetical protein
MSWFGKRRQQGPALDEEIDLEKAIAEISARQAFLQALTFRLVAELSPKKRDSLLEELQEVVPLLMLCPPPYVSSHKEQDFKDEVRHAMQVLLEWTTRPKPTRKDSAAV